MFAAWFSPALALLTRYRTSSPSRALARRVWLRPGEVERTEGIPFSRIAIRATRGAVWLTTTPADGDVILRAGDSITLRGGRPVVMQGVDEGACVEIQRTLR